MYYRNNRRPNQNRNIPRKVKSIDVQLFINKAQPDIKQKEVSTSDITFNSFNLDPKIKHNILKRGLTNPTPIQEGSIPHSLNGKDVIGIANTGTGKTAAFLLPTIQKMYNDSGEQVLIITPTRELALQIIQEFHHFAKNLNIRAVLLIGGERIERQERELNSNPQLVIGTPGRIKDLVNRRKLNLINFKTIVLDEVDRMVDIGFIHDIKFLISFLSKKRQSLFFSATVTEKVKVILEQFVTNPITVSVKKQETPVNIEQDVINVRDKFEKLEVLEKMLKNQSFEKVLIFGRTKWGVEKLSKHLIRSGVKAAAIHGNKSQNQRVRALQLFKQNQLQVLLATDVASRGLDIDNITHVINYDAPDSHESYIHRIGRTGRADQKGIALTFVEQSR